MPHVVTSACIGCKHADCVVVCPAECFHEDEKMLYIDPEDCIDCCQCVQECPEEAIFAVDDLPEALSQWTEINALQSAECPSRLDK